MVKMQSLAVILLLFNVQILSVLGLLLINNTLTEKSSANSDVETRSRRYDYTQGADNIECSISGAAFGGSLYLCSFISYNGDDPCKYVTTPEPYYVFVKNDFIRITGQLTGSTNSQRILTTVNLEFFDEQGRTSSVYSRSLNGMFAKTCESESPVHYRFLDDNTKDIRLIECSSSNAVYLLNDRRLIYIAILPTQQGLWLSVNLCKEIVDKSSGILVHGLPASLSESMLPYNSNANPEAEINQCYLDTNQSPSGAVTVPSSVMGGTDASAQLRKICVDSLRRGVMNSASMQQQYNQINQRTSILTQHHSSSQLPLYLTKLEASFEPALFQPVTTLPINYKHQTSHGKSGQCTCLESLPGYNWPRSDSVTHHRSANESVAEIYPHSMMAVEENDQKNVVVKGIITPSRHADPKSSKAVTVKSKEAIFRENEAYPNYIVRYDSKGARLGRTRRNAIEDIKLNRNSSFVKLREFNLLDWMDSGNYQSMMCSVARELQPTVLIVSLNPKRYLNCSTNSNNATVMSCEKNPNVCKGSYNLIINL